MKITGKETISFLFNQGCDARVNGMPQSSCPYEDQGSICHWMAGWRHAHDYYGCEVYGRWWFKPLPPIRYERMEA